MAHSVQRIETSDGISWHIELFTPQQNSDETANIVLIPSGEGDCESLVKLASILATNHGYRVLTFDNPGFSRTQAPLAAYDVVTPQLMAKQIHGLCKQLGFEKANVFGCSSGGCATLAIAEAYPQFLNASIIHEVPLSTHGSGLLSWVTLDDEEIGKRCAALFQDQFNDRPDLWNALGPEYHARLFKNYVTWLRHFQELIEPHSIALIKNGAYKQRPVFWTVGGLNPDARNGYWKSNFDIAEAAGLKVNDDVLQCLHFPSVSIPEKTAQWINTCIKSV